MTLAAGGHGGRTRIGGAAAGGTQDRVFMFLLADAQRGATIVSGGMSGVKPSLTLTLQPRVCPLLPVEDSITDCPVKGE